ncbi:hypothetical protein DFJ74DRAFT_423703 [Hyaloraphidium curvatum]|nr:hypothetical protein DFJ74DRAFT_423703 [Hyaloraphidium curvatum]
MEDPPLRPATPPRTPPQPTTSNESLADPGPAPAEPAQFPGLGTGRPRDQIPEHDSRVEAPMELALPRSGDQGPLAADYSNTDYWRSRLAGQTHLHATKEFIGDSDSVIRALSEALKGNTMLRSLLLPRNNIGPEGARQLAEALKWNSVLKDLDLSGNSIGDVGATALAELLKGNTALFSLGLAANSIGPEGARALAEALKGKSVLRSLTLSQNSIGHEGAGALAEALKGNSVLEKLDLHGNSIGDDCASALADLLNRNKGPPKRLRSARQQSSGGWHPGCVV